MCLKMITLPNGQQVRCRVCGMCREDLVNDWVGRCRAEAETSAHTFFVTLTYGQDDKYGGAEDNLPAKKLDYGHIRNYMMLLRKWTALDALGNTIPRVVEKTRIRYFAVGEYGSKGRAHWHLLIFCEGRMPPNIQLSERGGPDIRFMHDHQGGLPLWPWGWSHWRLAEVTHMRYAIGYMAKGDDVWSGTEKRYGLSIKPPLGDEFFRRRAKAIVSAGLVPRDCFYEFPDVLYGKGPSKGLPRRFFLGGSALYNFLNEYAIAWKLAHGNENWPSSMLMDQWEELRDKRRQQGLWSWKDEPDWNELRMLERYGKWGKSAVETQAAHLDRAQKVEGLQRPLTPLEAYETGSRGR